MNVSIQTASITDKGLSSNYTVNEDSYLILEADGVFAVADGVGGANAGELASKTALSTICELISGERKSNQRTKENLVDFVKKLIKESNKAIHALGKEREQQIASTIVIMLLEEDYAILGHVGDSRIYVYRDRKLIQLTRDHSKLQNLIDNNLIKPAEESDFQDRHIITKALGIKSNVEPDIQKVNLKNKDLFILCTDGIYIHNSNEEMLANIKQNRGKLQKICDVLKENCYEKGATDNLTAVVLKIAPLDMDEQETKIIKAPDYIDTIIKKQDLR